MKPSVWIGFGALTMIVGTIIGSISLEMARPGKVLCPLRRIFEKWDIEIDDYLPEFIDEINIDESQQAKDRAIVYRKQALTRFPNLHIQPRSVPIGENGYHHLCQLGNQPIQPDRNLTDCLENWKALTAETARAALAKNQAWIDHIETIASMPGSSSMDSPTEFQFSRYTDLRQAVRTMVAKSLVEAADGNEQAAMRAIRSHSRLTGHLQNHEAPSIMEDLQAVVFEGLKAEFIIEKILPEIGQDADLQMWQNELWQLDFRAERIVELARGDWITTTKCGGYEEIWRLHFQHELPDPDESAMVIAEAISNIISHQGSYPDTEHLKELAQTRSFRELTPEGKEIVEMVTWGLGYWMQKMEEARRRRSLHQAALDLLLLERKNGAIHPQDIHRATLDPLTGQPFSYDPATGVLTSPAGAAKELRDVEVQLPWRKPTP